MPFGNSLNVNTDRVEDPEVEKYRFNQGRIPQKRNKRNANVNFNSSQNLN